MTIHAFAPFAPETPARVLLCDLDWSNSPLGEPENWTAAFRIGLAFILASPEAMYLVWGPERRLFFNDAYIPLLGSKLAGAMGGRLEEVWSDVWDDVRYAVYATFAGSTERWEDQPLAMNRNGSLEETFWTYSFSPFRDEHGVVVGLVCLTTEQTKRIDTEKDHQIRTVELTAEVARSRSELLEAEGQLRQSQKLEAIGQLTGGVAHDFNNLLTVIRGSAEMLGRENLTPERRTRYLNAINDTAARATKLTGQLLAFARRQALQPEIFDAGRSIEEAATIIGTLCGPRIEVRIQVPDERVYVLADRGQLDTAIVNMAINARDAMNGEGRLTIAAAPVSGIPAIRSHTALVGDFVAVTITDDGIGIPENQIGRIFEPFFTTKGVGEGTGLGLSQVFGFAKQSGGDIRVDTRAGVGTTFTLYVPRAYPNASLVDTHEAGANIDGNGLCVLVVEDNEGVGKFATEALKELGYDSILAVNAEEALAELAKNCSRFHVVFSDVVMPGMTGLELGAQIRRDYPDVPVILTSGYSHVLAKDGKFGFELLHKPYSVEQLSSVLRKAAAWAAKQKSSRSGGR